MFTVAMFTIAKAWKQPKCPLTEEWIRMWYTHTMEYYSAMKRKEIAPFAVTWVDLESIVLSEVKSYSEREIQYDMPYMQNQKRNDTNQLICKAETDSQN